MSQNVVSFNSAQPVWLAGRTTEKNLLAGFRAFFEAPAHGRVVLRLTASCLYRAFINGMFCSHGPARGPHGFFRVDEWDLTSRLKVGRNAIAIEVAGYNVNSYYLLDQPSCLQAEVVCDGVVLAATGSTPDFRAAQLDERVQKVARYSYQRPFSEIYRMSPEYSRWRSDESVQFGGSACEVLPSLALLPRRLPLPLFDLRRPVREISGGRIRHVEPPAKLCKDRFLTNIGPQLGGFLESELERIPSIEFQSIAFDRTHGATAEPNLETHYALQPESWRLFDLGENLTGFLGLRVHCRKRTRVCLLFDEILSGDDVDILRLNCANVVDFELKPGVYNLETFEPYTLRYLKLVALGGACEVDGLYLREYCYPDVWRAQFACSDVRLNRIFSAARETFRQNCADLFMDCPSRERAGWLCDSYFTARVAFDLCGDTLLEKNFLENFLLPPRFAHLPDGMFPMCYPADHYSGRFIPNWALWLVLQLEEYYARSADRELIAAFEPKIKALLDYFRRFLNEDGMLEKLESWVFVEWSEANKFVQDVNYPSNMLYAAALAAAGRLYRNDPWQDQATQLRARIAATAFDGSFFIDNALRSNGTLKLTDNHSEVCQYFAFYFGIATPQTHPKLWSTLCAEFGPKRKETKAWPNIHPANSFIGNVLRIELLSRFGLSQQATEENREYLLYMAERTGTLWENDSPTASCNHGFASHAVRQLYRDVLGVRRLDSTQRQIDVKPGVSGLEWSEGILPTAAGPVQLRWWKEGSSVRHTLSHPAQFVVRQD